LLIDSILISKIRSLSSGNGSVDFTQGNLHDSQFSRMLDGNGVVYIDIDNHAPPNEIYFDRFDSVKL